MATCLNWNLDKERPYDGIVHSTCYVEKCLPDAQRIQDELRVEYLTDYELPIPRMKIWEDCAVESPLKLVKDEDYCFSIPGVLKFRNAPQSQKEQLHQSTEQRASTELESDLPEDPREIIVPDNLPAPTATGPVLSALEKEAKVRASSLDEVYTELQTSFYYDENMVSATDLTKAHTVNGAGNFRVSTVRDLTKFSVVVHQKGDPYDVATGTVAFGLGKTKSESFKIAAKLLILMFNQINCEL